MTLLIKNGHVLNPATNMDEIADVLVVNEKVEKLGKNLKEKADRVIDAKGCYVMPGFVDLHVHLRDPGLTHKEDVYTGMAAGARGGYTTIFAMPNTKPVVDHADVVRYVHNKAVSGKMIHVLQIGAITRGQRGEELAEIEEMVQAGAPAISEDGKSVMNADLYREAMKIAGRLDIPVFAHCEDINMVHGGVVNHDLRSEEFSLPGISNSVEDVIIARDIIISKETGCQLHLCHCSTADSVKMVEAAKKDGLRVTAEVCPHHFCLTSDDIREHVPKIIHGKYVPNGEDVDTNYKMNPPLRTRADVNALKEGLRNGIMDVISTDHAPHTYEEKNVSIRKAPFGIVGLETAASLTHDELVLKGVLTPLQMAEKMSYNPAKVAHLDKGDIQPGKVADIVIFDPEETYTIDKNTFASKGRNTPFDGKTVTGRVKYTICDGNVVYDGNN